MPRISDRTIELAGEFLEEMYASPFEVEPRIPQAEQCHLCGRMVSLSDGRYVHLREGGERGSQFICNHCMGRRVYICEECGIHTTDGNVDEHGRHICDECAYSCYERCDICKRMFRGNRRLHRMFDGSMVCKNCEEKIKNGTWNPLRHIRRDRRSRRFSWGYCYHSVDTSKGKGDSLKDGELYLGFELETHGDSEDMVNEDLRDFFMDNEFYNEFIPMDDGSIIPGVEFISSPMTLAEHEASVDRYRQFCDGLIDIGMEEESSCCGLHVHMSRSFFSRRDLRVLDAIVQKNKTFWEHVSRRRSNRYCKIHQNAEIDSMGIDMNSDEDKHNAVSFPVYGKTVEFRMFKGTLDVDTLMNSLRLIDGLARFSKTISFATAWNNPEYAIVLFIQWLKDNGYNSVVQFIGLHVRRSDCRVKKGR